MSYIDDNEFLKNELELFEYLINRTRTELRKNRYFGIDVKWNTTLKGMINAIENRQPKQRLYTFIIATSRYYDKIQPLALLNFKVIKRTDTVNNVLDLKKIIETKFTFLQGNVVSYSYPVTSYYNYYSIDREDVHESGGYRHYSYYKTNKRYRYSWGLTGKTQDEFNQLRVKNEDLILVNYAVMERR